MNPFRHSLKITVFAAALCRAVGCSSCTGADPPWDITAVIQAWSHDPDVVGCADCHYARNPLRQTASSARQDGMATWLTLDRHAVARALVEPRTPGERNRGSNLGDAAIASAVDVLWNQPSGKRSRAICDRLGIDVTTNEGYLAFRDQCLRCHAGIDPLDAQRWNDIATSESPGISCLACHQEGQTRDWISQHGNRAEWRLLSHEAKRERGLSDLTGMAARAGTCLDCHLGNLRDGKFVTHAMFVAGHPPLPAFEPQSASERMHRHWLRPGETFAALKGDKDRGAYFAVQYPTLFENAQAAEMDGKSHSFETHGLLIAGLQAQRQAVELLRDSTGTVHAGDFALFDCAACHHELRTDSLRQTVGFPGIPGRPRLAAWTEAIATLARPPDGKSRETTPLIVAALDARPFGDPASLTDSCDAVLSELNELGRSLESKTMDKETALLIRQRLTELPPRFRIDADCQRMIESALAIVDEEL